MNQTAQQSQLKKVVKVSVMKIDFRKGYVLNLRLIMSDNSRAAVGICFDEIPAFVSQIESALADEMFILRVPNGRTFLCAENVMRHIRERLSSFSSVSRGASDANHVRGGVSTPAKIKASARKASASSARQFKPKKRGCRAKNAGSKSPVAATAPIRTKNGRTSVVVGTRKVS